MNGTSSRFTFTNIAKDMVRLKKNDNERSQRRIVAEESVCRTHLLHHLNIWFSQSKYFTLVIMLTFEVAGTG